MHIVEIIIDGFKSYSTRTVISGFDRSFNAITGFNGSGKSNILDAICFVLGISNLSQVRVTNLQELVYKQGQAGVTKASVTIRFDNRDKSQSPIGFEQHDEITVTRQVVIGGRNKYIINGTQAQAGRVQNLFHSVQLNINNPHFLIMQGRITKVLNMKPHEILSMLEEAAGTRMYEMKKASALKTMEKKSKKLEEIDRMINEDITPNLEKLRKERGNYNKWSQNNTEIEKLTRFCTAFAYVKSQKTIETAEAKVEEANKRNEEMNAECEELLKDVQAIEREIEKLKKRKADKMESQLKSLEDKVAELSKAFVKHSTHYNHKREALEEEKQSLESLDESKKETEEAIQSKRKEQLEHQKVLEEHQQRVQQLAEKLDSLNSQLSSVSAGIAASGSTHSAKTSAEQLIECRTKINHAETQIRQCDLRMKDAQNELKKKRALANEADKDHEKAQAEYQKHLEEIKKLEASIAKLKYDEKKEEQLIQAKDDKEKTIRKLQEEVDVLSSQLSGLNFTYTDPERGFDRNRVKGLVAKLIRVKNPALHSTALEITAGGRLFQVVVDTEATGKALLEHGQLKRRVTIIPLNKISTTTLTDRQLQRATEIAGGNKENAALALELVGYDEEVENAMKYVFGQTIICKDLRTAEKVAYDPQVRTRTVTLDGDSFDPAGTLTGGARPAASATVLPKLQELNEKRDLLLAKHHQEELKAILRQIEEIKQDKAAFVRLKQQLELQQHAAELQRQRLDQSKRQRTLNECAELERQIESDKQERQRMEAVKQAEEERARQLETEMQNFDDTARERQLKQIEKQIPQTKKELAAAKTELTRVETQAKRFEVELESLAEEIKHMESQRAQLAAKIARMEEELATEERRLAERKAEYEQHKSDLDARKEALLACDKEIGKLLAERDEKTAQMSEIHLEQKKLGHRINALKKELEDAVEEQANLKKRHEWIAKEEQFFGKPQTDFDFSSRNPKEAQKRLNELQKEQAALTKTINKKVLSMFEKAEQEYQDLTKKKKIVENDKAKIEAVIAELDQKKKEALDKTYVKVNQDFGSIFSTLLPGTQARLERVQSKEDGGTTLEGCEVKVAFGDVWKESLTELSGGQRSLLALSLILALLLFKPAPMYILDEVDAALDLSHTQNIGRMLRMHFRNSQFIVVSLKEGMFSNANVVFRTKCVNGISSVYRIVNKNVNNNDDNNNNAALPAPSSSSSSSSSSNGNNEEEGPKKTSSSSQPKRKRARRGAAPTEEEGADDDAE